MDKGYIRTNVSLKNLCNPQTHSPQKYQIIVKPPTELLQSGRRAISGGEKIGRGI